MSNMSYCRFQNTVKDFVNCKDTLDAMEFGDERKLSFEEFKAAIELLYQAAELTVAVTEFTGVEAEDLEEEHFQKFVAYLQETAE